MNYNPLTENHDLIVTSRSILIEAMKLFSGYRTTEYHRFSDLEHLKKWLELDVLQKRTKILIFLPEKQIGKYLPERFYADRLSADPCFYGGYTANNPKFYIGKIAVYIAHTYTPCFPIYDGPFGNEFCVINDDTSRCGLYRSIKTNYLECEEVSGAS